VAARPIIRVMNTVSHSMTWLLVGVVIALTSVFVPVVTMALV
jgi:hypothetical protein